ncbi:MAG: fasciclin domain-containing protein [Saprospiraceae bacterium]|nr:fasciclin domain-containing protein [Saprospiraceae bacterium]MBP7699814.1 fasciclin domain-containing protein [Saprospiraceae bacterium]
MRIIITIVMFAGCVFLLSCGGDAGTQTVSSSSVGDVSSAQDMVGQSGVQDDVSNPNIVQVAVKSADHSTLVTAVKAAGLVDALSNAGPFTIFAPTNAAFQKLPAGTVEGLLKPEKKADLKSILEYHAYVGVLKPEFMQDGQEFEEVSGQKVKITKKEGKTYVNGSEIVASINTSNGVIHVINDVLLPK